MYSYCYCYLLGVGVYFDNTGKSENKKPCDAVKAARHLGSYRRFLLFIV